MCSSSYCENITRRLQVSNLNSTELSLKFSENSNTSRKPVLKKIKESAFHQTKKLKREIFNVINEKFKFKRGYSKNLLTTGSGSWLLEDALTGATAKDAKDGNWSVRIRSVGRLEMEFDVAKGSFISLKYACYGRDGPSSFQVYASTNQGRTFFPIGVAIVCSSHNLIKITYKIEIYKPVRFLIQKLSGGKNRINIDGIQIAKQLTSIRSESARFPKKRHIILTRNDQDLASSVNLLLGNPSNATSSISNPNNYLINHVYYTESYNRTLGEPNWVCWHIEGSDLGHTDRVNTFRCDTALPKPWYQARNISYNGSGFDRGHNCPSGDRTSSREANSSTFLMDNIIPQAPRSNRHTWETLEKYCRDKVSHGNEVYVIMGCYGSGGNGEKGYQTTIDKGRINVPSHIWKVLVILPQGSDDLRRMDSRTTIIAVDTPNDNSMDTNWMHYICTVSDIEKHTGYHFFMSLPILVRNNLKNKKCIEMN